MQQRSSELLARCTFPPPGTPIDCAVSGGADSLALLILAVDAGCDVTAWHVDHGLRPDSARDFEVVSSVAQRWGATARLVRVDVEAGPNVEDRARRARFDALPAGVHTGHTADDQAETVLLALLRGSGLDGLSGMAPIGRARHPLLALRRAETALLCDDYGIVPVADETNDDGRIRRNRIRHELLPLASEIAARDVVPLVARAAELLRGDAEVLDAMAASVDATDARTLCALPPGVARRAIRGWLASAVPPYPPSAAAVERVLAVARGEAGACEVAGIGRVSRHQQRLVLHPRG